MLTFLGLILLLLFSTAIAFLVFINLSTCLSISASSIFSNKRAGLFILWPGFILLFINKFSQPNGLIFKNSRIFSALRGKKGSSIIDKLADICKEMFNIVFTLFSFVFI